MLKQVHSRSAFNRVILSGGEAGVRDLTSEGRLDDADRSELNAYASGDPAFNLASG